MPNQSLPAQETLDFVMRRLGQALLDPIKCPKCGHEHDWEAEIGGKAQGQSARDFLLQLLSLEQDDLTVNHIYKVSRAEGYTSSAIRKARSRCSGLVENYVIRGVRCWRILPEYWEAEHKKWYGEEE